MTCICGYFTLADDVEEDEEKKHKRRLKKKYFFLIHILQTLRTSSFFFPVVVSVVPHLSPACITGALHVINRGAACSTGIWSRFFCLWRSAEDPSFSVGIRTRY